jgi:hypothetical protein
VPNASAATTDIRNGSAFNSQSATPHKAAGSIPHTHPRMNETGEASGNTLGAARWSQVSDSNPIKPPMGTNVEKRSTRLMPPSSWGKMSASVLPGFDFHRLEEQKLLIKDPSYIRKEKHRLRIFLGPSGIDCGRNDTAFGQVGVETLIARDYRRPAPAWSLNSSALRT